MNLISARSEAVRSIVIEDRHLFERKRCPYNNRFQTYPYCV